MRVAIKSTVLMMIDESVCRTPLPQQRTPTQRKPNKPKNWLQKISNFLREKYRIFTSSRARALHAQSLANASVIHFIVVRLLLIRFLAERFFIFFVRGSARPAEKLSIVAHKKRPTEFHRFFFHPLLKILIDDFSTSSQINQCLR